MGIIVAILATLGAAAAWTLNWELSSFLFAITTSILVWKTADDL